MVAFPQSDDGDKSGDEERAQRLGSREGGGREGESRVGFCHDVDVIILVYT